MGPARNNPSAFYWFVNNRHFFKSAPHYGVVSGLPQNEVQRQVSRYPPTPQLSVFQFQCDWRLVRHMACGTVVSVANLNIPY